MIWNFIIQIVIAVISYLLSPKPESPTVVAGEQDIPVVDMGSPIPVVFGTVWINRPQVVWYGDLRTTPVKSKGK